MGARSLPEWAISIKQPFAELILRGIKRAEYRSMRPHATGRVFIYASLTDKPWTHESWNKLPAAPESLLRGALVGTVTITGARSVVRKGVDQYAWGLRAPRRLRIPITPDNQPQPVLWRPRFPGSPNGADDDEAYDRIVGGRPRGCCLQLGSASGALWVVAFTHHTRGVARRYGTVGRGKRIVWDRHAPTNRSARGPREAWAKYTDEIWNHVCEGWRLRQ